MLMTDDELQAAIMDFLLREGRWGANYFPVDTLTRWFAKKAGDGRRVRKCLKKLINMGYLLPHKKGDTVSLNSSRRQDIDRFIKGHMPK